jgi:hypothetical protein
MRRCPKCFTVLWSGYSSTLKVLRVGTVDGVVDKSGEYVPTGGLRPDAHLFAGEGGSKHGWIGLEGERVFEGLGKKEDYWSRESLERWEVFVKGGMGGK